MNREVHILADRFRTLELHAARGGREVRRVLLAAVDPKAQTGSCTPESMLRVLQAEIEALLPALPPYAPPFRRMNELLVGLEDVIRNGLDAAEAYESLSRAPQQVSDPVEVADLITRALAARLPERSIIYTHTLSETVLNVIQNLHSQGRIKKVIVTESRPNLDGRVTVQRLAQCGVPVYLTIDAAMPAAIVEADSMLTGAEAIDKEGQVVGKVGAFPAAILCSMHRKPVYVIADSSKLFPLSLAKLPFTPLTNDIFPEGGNGWLPFGTYFDVTQSKYIQAYVNERGVVTLEQIQEMIRGLPVSPWLSATLGM